MFDLKKLERNKKKYQQKIQDSSFFQFINNDLIDRIQPIDRDFKEILIIQPSIERLLTLPLKEKYPNHNLSITHQYTNLQKNKFDLIIFPMGLHWVSDVQGFLHNTHQALQKDGILVSNFPGGGSLNKLRYKLIEIESINSKPHTPHISPFIQFEQVVPLLQQARFVENIIDMEKLELEYDSALDLMKTLKIIGESNALQSSIPYSINKKMYQELKNSTEKLFTDQINLITFVSSPTKSSIKLKSEHFHG
jgi:NADH dehydrogenase [ubiquinone] 1 alpha subcomplex assembly factor 5